MAAADPPAGLLDIASTLPQDEIPFKLRCAICNKLAVNAFRLPCCDQSICEPCQTALSDTCHVCAHTPVSPDLCKPNKALRTTLKAFLRTEEKKREKERQSAATPTPVADTPAQSDPIPTEGPTDQNGTEEVAPPAQVAQIPQITASDQAPVENNPVETKKPDTVDNDASKMADPVAESETLDQPTETAPVTDEGKDLANGEAAGPDPAQTPEDPPQQSNANMMNMGPGGFSGMGWNGMNPFMSNMSTMPNMFNFQNPMGMPMSMDPMAANQGMFGDYGMNMGGMGMNMGMNYSGQGMYGSSGWNGSWQGGQNNFNANAFANGTGPQHGGAFGGPNMSYPSNSGYQSGYYGQGYGRGGFQGSNRGGFGGFGPGHHSQGTNPEMSTSATLGTPHEAVDNTDDAIVNGDRSHLNENGDPEPVSQPNAEDKPEPMSDEQGAVSQQLQGIPTIDSLDQSVSNGPSSWQGPGPMGPGYGPVGRGGGYWPGPASMAGPYQHQHQHPIPPKAPVVEGAPAAPRGMRQGLPNTSMLRQRAFQQGRAPTGSITPATSQGGNSEPRQDPPQAASPANPPSQIQQTGSKSRSPSPSRARSSTTNAVEDDTVNRREREPKRSEPPHETRPHDARSSSGQERESGRRNEYRSSHRSRGHRSRANSRSRSRSRSRSPGRNGDSRQANRPAPVIEGKQLNGHKTSSEAGDSRDPTSRINSRRSSKERSVRREEDRDRDRARDGRRRERDRRERDRDSNRDRRRSHDRERNRDRDRERERDRERDRDRERERGRGGRDRDRDRKRSRRDRSESANASDHSSRPQPRRLKRETGSDRNRNRASKPEKEKGKEKDPYTLAREAANRERLLREQQNREVKSQPKSSRRESRQERLVGGRRINFKYEDEL